MYLRLSTDPQTVQKQLADMDRLVGARGDDPVTYGESSLPRRPAPYSAACLQTPAGSPPLGTVSAVGLKLVGGETTRTSGCPARILSMSGELRSSRESLPRRGRWWKWVAVAAVLSAIAGSVSLCQHEDYGNAAAVADASAREFIRRAASGRDVSGWGVTPDTAIQLRGCSISSYRYRDVSLFAGDPPLLHVHVACGKDAFAFTLQRHDDSWRVDGLTPAPY